MYSVSMSYATHTWSLLDLLALLRISYQPMAYFVANNSSPPQVRRMKACLCCTYSYCRLHLLKKTKLLTDRTIDRIRQTHLVTIGKKYASTYSRPIGCYFYLFHWFKMILLMLKCYSHTIYILHHHIFLINELSNITWQAKTRLNLFTVGQVLGRNWSLNVCVLKTETVEGLIAQMAAKGNVHFGPIIRNGWMISALYSFHMFFCMPHVLCTQIAWARRVDSDSRAWGRKYVSQVSETAGGESTASGTHLCPRHLNLLVQGP